MKLCSVCKQEKPKEEFASNRSRNDGLNTACRSCQAAYMRDYYAKNKSKHITAVSNSKKKTGDSYDCIKNSYRLHRRIQGFFYKSFKPKKRVSDNWETSLYTRIYGFMGKKTNNKDRFTVDDVVNKFGKQPICYLTGRQLDFESPDSYQLDHIISKKQGGGNTIDNLGVCCPDANQAKTSMSPEELMVLCKEILEHNGYEVKKKSS